MKIRIEELSNEIMKGLKEYADTTASEIKSAVRETAQEVKQTLQETSPKDTGQYAKSWAIKVQSEQATNLNVVIHSPKHYSLTHLLEFGHATRNGGRTEAQPHIEPAEQQAISTLQQRLEVRL
ncbi:HK97 gp10 family phage protein [Tuanshanicoccus lijuaniae]|uniref:HK97 gp10 family phage protein n=1 Tax=Aerococcaceae bacterium zg-1292 TaxID=2774330 RepID=UPI0019351F11|nr:HK97 gp10 family phage protein [Aerococcaceae bacterium zg-1292]QQA38053.1 HK97 gp10 family phage protein [Aerococcaceae bacterium zg-1292]